MRRIECQRCGEVLAEGRPRCQCGGLGVARLELGGLDGATLRRRFEARRGSREAVDRSGVWRYRELVLPEAAAAQVITKGEGNTGLYDAPRLARELGLGSLSIKHEGENPTGSFKDRGMTVGVTRARMLGARAIACASTGNTSAALAAYGAAAGLAAVVFVPQGKISRGKLAQTIAYGARVLEVAGDFDDAMRLVEAASQSLGLALLNSINPWRIEGQKTIVIELLDERGWRVPDWIILPAGNLGNTAAFGKALRELLALGLIDRSPRLCAVQAEGAAPFARFFEARRHDPKAAFQAEPHPETVASAIRIGSPVSWERAIAEIDASRGLVRAASDAEILRAKATIDACGIGCEPASAASLAGLRRLCAEGIVGVADDVVLVLTGHLLKDPDVTLKWHEEQASGNRPQVVPARLDAIAAAISDLAGGV